MFVIVSLIWAIPMCPLHMPFSGKAHKHTAQAQILGKVSKIEVVNLVNKICLVSDEEINEKVKSTYEYKGKSYNLCYAACIEELKGNLDKYIKKIEA